MRRAIAAWNGERADSEHLRIHPLLQDENAMAVSAPATRVALFSNTIYIVDWNSIQHTIVNMYCLVLTFCINSTRGRGPRVSTLD